ncbi:RNA 2'-phosphotransferase [Novosphingobium lindaniclasticum]
MNEMLKTSKALSYWLRHAPDAGNLSLDSAGWADTKDVLVALDRAGLLNTLDDLTRVVAESDKSRFELSMDGTRIRARQGHSITVDAGWIEAAAPPAKLYHGTIERFLASIMREGLVAKSRHHVHLSKEIEAARIVAQRRGAPTILEIDAKRLAQAGFRLLLSTNGVWLADRVPPEFLRVLRLISNIDCTGAGEKERCLLVSGPSVYPPSSPFRRPWGAIYSSLSGFHPSMEKAARPNTPLSGHRVKVVDRPFSIPLRYTQRTILRHHTHTAC